MLCLDADKEELVRRIVNRGLTSGRADDTDAATIENRISVYNEKTAPIIDYYAKQGKHHGVPGVGSIEEIAEKLRKSVEAACKK